MDAFAVILLSLLIVCAVAASLVKGVLPAIVIFMSFSLIMSILWIVLESPDLAITEAAVGAGVTSILFFVTLRKIKAMKGDDDENEPDEEEK